MRDGTGAINFLDQKQPKQGASKGGGKRRQRNTLARKEIETLTQDASVLDRASPMPEVHSMGHLHHINDDSKLRDIGDDDNYQF